ncbi:MAG: hypothetical protein NT062_03050 [Proteobacteria bacterium]|nr:hypothetical protein [Pseudomonadota bacterium]
MSKENPMPTKSESTRGPVTAVPGVVPGAVHLALDVADRGQSATFALLQEGRAELTAVVVGGVELAERATASVFRLVKRAAQRLDEVGAETLAGVERLATTTVKAARDTTRATTELAHTALGGLAGQAAAA